MYWVGLVDYVLGWYGIEVEVGEFGVGGIGVVIEYYVVGGGVVD